MAVLGNAIATDWGSNLNENQGSLLTNKKSAVKKHSVFNPPRLASWTTQAMKYHDQQTISPIWTPHHRTPRKPVPIKKSDGDSASRPISEYTSVQASNSPVYPDQYSPNPTSPQFPSYSSPPPPVGRRGLFSGGWRSGCTYCAMAALLVFLTNTCLTIWASYTYKESDGIGTIYEGSCDRTKNLSLVAHILINAMGTVLLSASNYTMQCLSAPTRADVDKAHAVKKWLDIGIPSVKNLGKIDRVRLVLWCLLAMSSVPLHFIYNSAVFSTLSTYNYKTRVVTESNATLYTSVFSEPQRLEKRVCIGAYGKQFLSDRRHLVIVASQNIQETHDGDGVYINNELSLGFDNGKQPFDWMCLTFGYYKACGINDMLAKADNWKIEQATVHYCISEVMPEECSLQYSLHIMIVVIACNAVKSICMFLVVFKSKEDPLVTVGDAIASFLDSPDETTAGMCVVSKQEIENGIWESRTVGASPEGWYPFLWSSYRGLWFRAASGRRWVICYCLSLAGICTASGYLARSNMIFKDNEIPCDLTSLRNMGFGAVDVRAITSLFPTQKSNTMGLISSVLVANLPQAIFSFLYLLYNSTFTCMLLGDEWDRFSYQRRPLRVTTPTGAQRSTHFLQLPYKYSLPLIIASGFMHWLISQSIFLARINIDKEGSVTTHSMIGWSPIAIITGLMLAVLMLAAAIANGFRRYQGGIPLVGNCSAAISAACHPNQQEPPPATLPVLWGVVSRDGYIGHCSFSSMEVEAPVPGHHYAGKAIGGVGRYSVGDRVMRDRGRRRE